VEKQLKNPKQQKRKKKKEKISRSNLSASLKTSLA